MDHPSNDEATYGTPKRVLATFLLLSLLARGGMLLAPQALRADPDHYRAVAENLVSRGTFAKEELPTAYRPPLYPVVLTACVACGAWSRTATAVLHLGLGLGTVWLTYWLGRRWGLGRFAFLAGALVACDPILLAQSALVMTETLAAFLAAASLAALTWFSERPSVGRAAAAGGCIALAALCRPTFLPFLGVAAIAVPWLAATWPQTLRLCAAFVAAAAVVLAPWAIRNQLQLGRPIIATTHGGYNLLLGNNPHFYEYLRSGEWGTPWWSDQLDKEWFAEIPHATPADEIVADRMAYARAKENIRREPGMFLYSCLVRAGRLWSLLPHQRSPEEGTLTRWARYAVGAWYLLVLSLALAGLLHLGRLILRQRGPGGGNSIRGARRTSWTWGILLAACFTAVHTLYWTDLRMRGPLMPAVALAACLGAAWVRAMFARRNCLRDNQLRLSPNR